eukprot:m.286087 g.286087  ORF g.286087 m.286087 type:complete len:465 (-) comp17778_c0_seq8:1896-3290(-)
MPMCDGVNHYADATGNDCKCGHRMRMEAGDVFPSCDHHIVEDTCVMCGHMVKEVPGWDVLTRMAERTRITGGFLARFEFIASGENGPLSRIPKVPWMGGMFYICWQVLEAGHSVYFSTVIVTKEKARVTLEIGERPAGYVVDGFAYRPYGNQSSVRAKQSGRQRSIRSLIHGTRAASSRHGGANVVSRGVIHNAMATFDTLRLRASGTTTTIPDGDASITVPAFDPTRGQVQALTFYHNLPEPGSTTNIVHWELNGISSRTVRADPAVTAGLDATEWNKLEHRPEQSKPFMPQQVCLKRVIKSSPPLYTAKYLLHFGDRFKSERSKLSRDSIAIVTSASAVASAPTTLRPPSPLLPTNQSQMETDDDMQPQGPSALVPPSISSVQQQAVLSQSEPLPSDTAPTHNQAGTTTDNWLYLQSRCSRDSCGRCSDDSPSLLYQQTASSIRSAQAKFERSGCCGRNQSR